MNIDNAAAVVAAAAAVFATAVAAARVAWDLSVEGAGHTAAAAAAVGDGRALGERCLIASAALDQEGHRYLGRARGRRPGGCYRGQSKDEHKALPQIEAVEPEAGVDRRQEEGLLEGLVRRCSPRRLLLGARRQHPPPWLYACVGLPVTSRSRGGG